MVKKKKSVSNDTILIGVVVLLVLSIVGTLLVLNAVSNIDSVEAEASSGGNAEISLTVVEPEEEPEEGSATISLEVVEPEE